MSELAGDLCYIKTLNDEDDFFDVEAAIHHADPAVLEASRALLAVPRRIGEGVSGRVAATGQPILIPAVDTEQLRA
jgi:hypothetical protein